MAGSALRKAVSAAGAFALSAALALTMTPFGVLGNNASDGEAFAATTTALDMSHSAAVAKSNRVSQQMALSQGGNAGADSNETADAAGSESGASGTGAAASDGASTDESAPSRGTGSPAILQQVLSLSESRIEPFSVSDNIAIDTSEYNTDDSDKGFGYVNIAADTQRRYRLTSYWRDRPITESGVAPWTFDEIKAINPTYTGGPGETTHAGVGGEAQNLDLDVRIEISRDPNNGNKYVGEVLIKAYCDAWGGRLAGENGERSYGYHFRINLETNDQLLGIVVDNHYYRNGAEFNISKNPSEKIWFYPIVGSPVTFTPAATAGTGTVTSATTYGTDIATRAANGALTFNLPHLFAKTENNVVKFMTYNGDAASVVGTFTFTPVATHVFNSWAGSNSSGAIPLNNAISTNTTITAIAYENIKQITYDLNAPAGSAARGTPESALAQYTVNGELKDLPTNVYCDGYYLKGWYRKNDDGTKNGNTTRKVVAGWTDNVKLYADWEEKVYTVAFDAVEAGTVSANNAGTAQVGDKEMPISQYRFTDNRTAIADTTNTINGGVLARVDGVTGFSFKSWTQARYTAGDDTSDAQWNNFSYSLWKALWPNDFAENQTDNLKQPDAKVVHAYYDKLGFLELRLGNEGPTHGAVVQYGVTPTTADGETVDVENDTIVGYDDDKAAMIGDYHTSTTTAGVQTLYVWQNKGIVGSQNVHTNTGVWTEGTLESGMSAYNVANHITRKGYEFVGWGVPKESGMSEADVHQIAFKGEKTVPYKIYIEPTRDENGNANGLQLTGAGKDFVTTEMGNNIASGSMKQLEAVWDIVDDYKLALRLPRTAVTSVTDADSWKATADGSPGWHKFERTYAYWDTVDVPAYVEDTSRFTYEGWYTDRDGGYSVATGGSGDSLEVTPDAWSGQTGAGFQSDEDGLLRVTEEVDDDTYWLRYTTVQIGVAAPMFVYLCEDEPAYVVGNDGRTLLESKLNFTTTASTSHELVVTKVECDADAYDKTNDKFTEAEDTKGLLANGLLEKNPEFSGVKQAGDIDTQFFWLDRESTVETVRLDNGTTEGNLSTKDTSDGKSPRLYFGTKLDGTADNTLVQATYDADGNVANVGVDLRDYVVERWSEDDNDYTRMLTAGVEYPEGVTTDDQKAAYLETLKEQYASGLTTTFYYGLDLRRCQFVANNVKKYVVDAAKDAALGDGKTAEAAEALASDAHSVRLARLTFTFAPHRAS